MKKYFLLLITIVALSQLSAKAQAPPDSVLNKYHTGSSQEKYNVIYYYLYSFYKNDSLLIKKSLELIAYFKKQNDYSGIDYANLCLAKRAARNKHDYTTALNIALPILSAFKTRNDTTGIIMATFFIDLCYETTKNYAEVIKYEKELIPIYLARGDKKGLSDNYNEIGANYAQAFLPDSGLVYAQQALNIAYELKNDTLLSIPLSTLAENYIARGDYDLAMAFLNKARQIMILINENSLPIHTWFNNDYAQAYLGMKKYDSTIYYSHQSLLFSLELNDINQQLRAYEYLYKSFDAIGRQDSSNKYYRLAGTVKDSLLGSEKVKAIEAVTFSAMLRQQELDSEKIKTEDERKQNIQYALIALGIVTFIILFFLLSRSIIVTEKWISFFGILGLLIVFEFINLLIHPILERVTHHSPLLMLLALVAIASLLIPIHHQIEKWIKDKMTEKNKTKRLEHAKKTIENLESKDNSI